MVQLPLVTWIRFGLWLGVGLVVYFLYGYRNSKLHRA
jgi:APA family basic amino acid/polyamine antiporter